MGKESTRVYVLKREDQIVVPVPPMVIAPSGKHYLPSFRTERVALVKAVRS